MNGNNINHTGYTDITNELNLQNISGYNDTPGNFNSLNAKTSAHIPNNSQYYNNYYNSYQMNCSNIPHQSNNNICQNSYYNKGWQQNQLKNEAKRIVRKDFNGIGAFLLVSTAVSSAISIIILLFPIIIGAINNADDNFYILIEKLIDDGLFYWSYSSVISIVTFFIVAIIYAKIRRLNFNKLFTFKKNKFGTLTCLVVLGLSVSIFANIAANVFYSFFSIFDTNAGGTITSNATNLPDILIYFASVALVPALVEEFCFRGVILGSLRKYGDGLAVFISAAIFGALHGNFIQIPFAFILGLILGYMVVYTDSLLPSMIVHFLNNGISVLFDVLSQNKTALHLTDEHIEIINCCYMVALLFLGFIALIILSKHDTNFLKFKKPEKTVPANEHLKGRDIIAASFTSPTMLIFYIYCLVSSVSIVLSSFLGAYL